jgi:hypothetical protein
MKRLILFSLLLSAQAFAAKKLSVPGVQGPTFDLEQGKLAVTIDLPKVQWNIGGKVHIPKAKSSFMDITDLADRPGSRVQFLLDIDDIQSIATSMNAGHALADGRDLPGIQGGKLRNSLRVDLEKRFYGLSFFYHKSVFGIALPLSWDVPGNSTYTKLVINKKDVGQIGYVGSDANRAGQLVLFLSLKALNDPEFKKLIQLSMKHPDQSFKPKGE